MFNQAIGSDPEFIKNNKILETPKPGKLNEILNNFKDIEKITESTEPEKEEVKKPLKKLRKLIKIGFNFNRFAS